MGGLGNLSIAGALSTSAAALTSFSPGQLALYGTAMYSITLQAPATLSAGLTWSLPTGVPAANSFLTFSAPSMSTSSLSYTTFAGTGGVTLSGPTAGVLTIGFNDTFTDAGGNPLLTLQSGGAGSVSHLQISNSSTSPGSPSLTAVGGTNTTLELSDSGNGGVNLMSNGQPVLKAVNMAATNTEWATVNGAASGSPVVIGAADTSGTNTVSLELQPQGTSGVIIAGANLDTQTRALLAEIAVNSAGIGVTAGYLVILTGTVSPRGADSPGTGVTPTHGVIGIAVNTASPVAGDIAQVAYSGVATCAFDGSGVQFNHYVIPGAAGLCKDGGAVAGGTPPSNQSIGVSIQSSSGSGPAAVLLRLTN